MDTKQSEIIERIKKRREELDMSYQALADKIGMSKSTWHRYETGDIGKIGLDKLEGLANALNVSPAYLMGWEESDTEYTEGRYSGIRKSDEQYIGNISREEVEKVYKSLSELPEEAMQEFGILTQYLIDKYKKKED
jgi:transcriptional regulator with XRE-family HTH domain